MPSTCSVQRTPPGPIDKAFLVGVAQLASKRRQISKQQGQWDRSSVLDCVLVIPACVAGALAPEQDMGLCNKSKKPLSDYTSLLRGSCSNYCNPDIVQKRV